MKLITNHKKNIVISAFISLSLSIGVLLSTLDILAFLINLGLILVVCLVDIYIIEIILSVRRRKKEWKIQSQLKNNPNNPVKE